MKAFFAAGLLSCAVVLVASSIAWAVDPDQDKLSGKWTVESFDYNGNPVARMKDATREFKEGKYTLTPKVGDVIEGSVKLDSSQKPKTIDLEVNDRVLKGIYELEGDTLKMCYVLGDGPRPTEFASKPDSGIIAITHKRVK